MAADIRTVTITDSQGRGIVRGGTEEILGQTWHTKVGFAGHAARLDRRASPGFLITARLSAE